MAGEGGVTSHTSLPAPEMGVNADGRRAPETEVNAERRRTTEEVVVFVFDLPLFEEVVDDL